MGRGRGARGKRKKRLDPLRRFLFKLALELGVPNPNYLMNLPWSVIRDWQAFYVLEPFGGERGDLRTGYAFARMAGLIAEPKGKKGWSPKDFMPDYGKSSKKVVDPDTQFRKIKMINYLFGGKVIDKRAKNRKDDTGSNA